MKKIGYIGFGNLGQQVQAFVRHAWGSEIQEVFFDDNLKAKGIPNSFPFASYPDDDFSDCDLFLCLGYRFLLKRAAICSELKVLGRSLPNLVHPSSYIHPQATLGEGVIVYPRCIIDKGVRIDDGVLLNNGVVVCHDSVIESCSFLAPNVCISGFCSIGSCSFLGTGTLAADGIRVGKRCTVGIGTVVTKNVPSDASCIGNPMRLLSRQLSLSQSDE